MTHALGGTRALILAGGSGTRLWPRSTDDRPKPFLALAREGSSLLQDAARRAARVTGDENVFFSARASHADQVRRDFPGVTDRQLLLEPMRRNTAPALALAALVVAAEDPDAVLMVLPSDQAVKDEDLFVAALETGVAAARATKGFVTLGIPPTRPDTGYGYLEMGDEEVAGARRLARFVEKPDVASAERYVAAGTFLWNAGIFIFEVGVLLAEMERLCPEALEPVREAVAARAAGDDAGFAAAFGRARSISIDYAVMEKTPNVFTVPCPCGWSDLGSWEAVFEFRGGTGTSSVVEGPAFEKGGSGNLILSSGRPVRVLGLSGLVVVDSPEGILVMKQGDSDLLRASVEESLAGEKKA